jgi:hypothetical protein
MKWQLSKISSPVLEKNLFVKLQFYGMEGFATHCISDLMYLLFITK